MEFLTIAFNTSLIIKKKKEKRFFGHFIDIYACSRNSAQEFMLGSPRRPNKNSLLLRVLRCTVFRSEPNPHSRPFSVFFPIWLLFHLEVRVPRRVETFPEF